MGYWGDGSARLGSAWSSVSELRVRGSFDFDPKLNGREHAPISIRQSRCVDGRVSGTKHRKQPDRKGEIKKRA